MRLFIAINLPEEIQKAAVAAQSELKPAGADVRWTSAGHFHFTLKFLGDISPDRVEPALNAMEKALRGFGAFDLVLKGLGVFPDMKKPKVVWMGANDITQACTRLSAVLDDAFEPLGYGRETRPFAAHLTLGRVRSRLHEAALVELINKNQDAAAGTLHVETVELMRSVSTETGPEYTCLKSVVL
jgi:2'-5' RNA ligase